MQLTTHTDYALRLLIYLAVNHGRRTLTVLNASQQYGISTNHLAKVAQRMVQLGYVNSQRGRNGGLVLATPAEKINLGKLVRETETFSLVECFGAESTCPIESACRLKGVLGDAQNAFLGVLDDYSLADITRNASDINILLDEKFSSK